MIRAAPDSSNGCAIVRMRMEYRRIIPHVLSQDVRNDDSGVCYCHFYFVST